MEYKSKLDIKGATEYLNTNGIDWTEGWVKTQVYCGKIPSHKELSARVIMRADLDDIIRWKKRWRNENGSEKMFNGISSSRNSGNLRGQNG